MERKSKPLALKLKKLDTVFSEYIRRRDADMNGEVQCCTCSTKKHWKKMDCGHWIRRGYLGVRFDERNAHAQCVSCNQFLAGNPEKYDRFIINKYGMEVFDELIELSQLEIKWMQFEVDEKVAVYKKKIKDLDI